MCGWTGLLTRALGLQSGGSQGAGRGAEGLPCGLAVGKGIVLVLLIEAQPVCSAWMGSYNWPG